MLCGIGRSLCQPGMGMSKVKRRRDVYAVRGLCDARIDEYPIEIIDDIDDFVSESV